MAERAFVPEQEIWEVEMAIIPHFLFGQKVWQSLDERLVVRCHLEKGYLKGVMVTIKDDSIQAEIELLPLNKFSNNNKIFILYPEIGSDLNMNWSFMVIETSPTETIDILETDEANNI